jgi:hypothetical protein
MGAYYLGRRSCYVLLLPNLFMTQLVNPPLLPSPRLERRGVWVDSCPSSAGERGGESRGESRLCKEDREERPLRVVRAELRRRRDLGCSGLSGMTTGLSLVPSLGLGLSAGCPGSDNVALVPRSLHWTLVNAPPAMRAGVMLG